MFHGHSTAAPETPSEAEDLTMMCQMPSVIKAMLASMRKKMEVDGYVHLPGWFMRHMLVCYGLTDDILKKFENGEFHDGMAKDPLRSMTHRTLEGKIGIFM